MTTPRQQQHRGPGARAEQLAGGSDEVTHADRSARLAEAFVALTDTLDDDFDVIGLLQLLADQCAEFAEVGAVGILLRDQRGGLVVAATTSQVAERLELFEIQIDEGPCLETVANGRPTICRDLVAEADRWPRFCARAGAEGVRSVTSLPLRRRKLVLGALALFHPSVGGLDEAGQRISQAMVDVATIGILAQRTMQNNRLLAEQLQTALNSRVAVEQAKGMVAQFGNLSTRDAFVALRSYARNHNRRLSELSIDVVDGRIPPSDILKPSRA
jgi:hypothetical protein